MQWISDQNMTQLSPKILYENAVKSILADITHIDRALKYLICQIIKSLPAVKQSFCIIHRFPKAIFIPESASANAPYCAYFWSMKRYMRFFPVNHVTRF